MDAKVLAFTQANFPGAQVSLKLDVDPEYGDECMVVDVDVTGTVEELLELSKRWFSNLSSVAPGFELEYCLLVNPQ
jgi:hypothetical protein